MAKEKEAPKFDGTIAYSKHQVAGITPYSDRKAEPTLEEVLEKTEKDEVLSARKDTIVAKLKKQSEPNPKRYTVDPETGKIDVDEEEGEYTQKDAMMISASIKGKSGQYDAAIALITAAKALAPENQPNVAEKPKEFYVDPEGVIIKDPENGEYTLSEARAISQSLRKDKAAQVPQQKSLLDKVEEMSQGLISQRFAAMLGGNGQPAPPKDPVDEFFTRLDQVDKLKQRFAPAAEGSSIHALAQSGVRGELMKLLLEDERDRLKMQYDHETQVERNKHFGVLATTVKDNLGDGIQAIKMAAQEFGKPGGKQSLAQEASPQLQVLECGQCKARFTLPAAGLQEGQQLKCPSCGKTWTKEEIPL